MKDEQLYKLIYKKVILAKRGSFEWDVLSYALKINHYKYIKKENLNNFDNCVLFFHLNTIFFLQIFISCMTHTHIVQKMWINIVSLKYCSNKIWTKKICVEIHSQTFLHLVVESVSWYGPFNLQCCSFHCLIYCGWCVVENFRRSTFCWLTNRLTL